MKNGRIIFIFIVSLIALGLIVFTSNNKGYEKVGRVNEYVIYYDQTSEDDRLYSGYILKQGFYEVSFLDAIDNEEITEDYIEEIIALIEAYEALNND